MASSLPGVDRVERERAWHDRRFEGHDPRSVVGKYYAGTSSSDEFYRSRVGVASRRVLEYGCGAEASALDLAAANEVVGIDVSAVAVARARAAAADRGITGVRFAQMDAERTAFRDRSFDLVAGKGILHHLDLDRAFAELARLLAPEGRAVFREPLGSNPAIQLYRRLTPSLRSPDEHPLLPADFAAARRWFGEVDARVFHCASLAATPLRGLPGGGAVGGALDRFDSWMFRKVPTTRRLAWIVVLEVARPRPSGA